MLKQVVRFLGKLVDMHVKTVVSSGQHSSLRDLRPDQVAKKLNNYWISMRETFFSPMFLYMTLDQGTLGKKPTVCGAMALPNNVGAIIPPQVASGDKIPSRFSVLPLSWPPNSS